MENKNISKVKRGEIYLYDFGTNEGSIQNGCVPPWLFSATREIRQAVLR